MHQFPRRRYLGRELPHADRLTEDLQPLAEKAAGGINEQDVQAGVFTYARLESSCYYEGTLLAYDVSLSVETGANTYAKVDATGPDGSAANVQESMAWQQLQDIDDDSVLASTLNTGEDTLLVFGHVVYAVREAGATYTSQDQSRLQFAIGLDDSVVDYTCTGVLFPPDPPAREIYRGAVAFDPANDFDYRHVQRQQNGTGLANHLHAARMICTVPVSEGLHTVSVVGRRVPRHDGKVDNTGTGSEVQVYSRQLAVLRLKGWSKAENTFAAPTTVPVFEDGDTLSATAIQTNRLTPLVAAHNDLTEAAVLRGAFRHEHLPSVVQDVSFVQLTPAAAVDLPAFTTYVGHADTTSTPGVAGWQRISDGAGKYLTDTNSGAGWDITNTAGALVVLANVAVKRIWVVGSREDQVVGFFIIRYKDSTGTWNYVGVSEAPITPRNESDPVGADGATRISATPNQNPCEDDEPLMWVVSTADLIAVNPNATTIQEIEVVAATWDASIGGGLTVKMSTQNAALHVLVLKGVDLA